LVLAVSPVVLAFVVRSFFAPFFVSMPHKPQEILGAANFGRDILHKNTP
jgi:hypothetical protein